MYSHMSRIKQENAYFKGLTGDDIHDFYEMNMRIVLIIETMCDPGDYDHVCPMLQWSLVPPMSHCQEDIFAYCEMLPRPHWTHETSNRCQCNDNNIQRKKEMDPPIVAVIVFS